MSETVTLARVLVVSREIALLRPLWVIAESNSWSMESVSSGWEAMERIQSGFTPNLLVLDMPRGDSDSLHILRWLRRISPDLPLIAVFHLEDAAKRREATHLGAEEVLIGPLDEAGLEVAVRKHLNPKPMPSDPKIIHGDIAHASDEEYFLDFSHLMQKLRAQAEMLARVNVPVLILGEPGSGKGVVARLIHKLSVQSGFEMQRLNCGAVPAYLLEQELFGRDAIASVMKGDGRNGTGKLDSSQRGTLLIEEITEMPLSLQYRFLHAIQHHQLSRTEDNTAGGMRILVTSSAKLDRAVSEHRLREDLYYRLSAFTVNVPPLRQRKEEIKTLLQYSMHKIARHYGLPAREFSASALEICVNHSWPGNLPEMDTFVKRYLVAGEKEPLLTRSVARSPVNAAAVIASSSVAANATLNSELSSSSLKSLIQNVKSEAERNAIAAALEKTGWNRKAAARLLKVSYRTLLYKIERYRMTATPAFLAPMTQRRLIGLANEKRSGKVT